MYTDKDMKGSKERIDMWHKIKNEDKEIKDFFQLNEEEDYKRKDRMEILDLVMNYLKMAKKQVVKNDMKMANKNIEYAMEKMKGSYWNQLFNIKMK